MRLFQITICMVSILLIVYLLQPKIVSQAKTKNVTMMMILIMEISMTPHAWILPSHYKSLCTYLLWWYPYLGRTPLQLGLPCVIYQWHCAMPFTIVGLWSQSWSPFIVAFYDYICDILMQQREDNSVGNRNYNHCGKYPSQWKPQTHHNKICSRIIQWHSHLGLQWLVIAIQCCDGTHRWL